MKALRGPTLIAPSLRECEVSRIDVFEGFVMLIVSWEFVLFQLMEVEAQCGIFIFLFS